MRGCTKVRISRLSPEHQELLQSRRKLVIVCLRLWRTRALTAQFLRIPSDLNSIHLPLNAAITADLILRSETWLPSAERRVIDCTLRKDYPRLPEEKFSQVKLARNVFVCSSSRVAGTGFVGRTKRCTSRHSSTPRPCRILFLAIIPPGTTSSSIPQTRPYVAIEYDRSRSQRPCT